MSFLLQISCVLISWYTSEEMEGRKLVKIGVGRKRQICLHAFLLADLVGSQIWASTCEKLNVGNWWKLVENGWKWVKMGENGWKWVKMGENWVKIGWKLGENWKFHFYAFLVIFCHFGWFQAILVHFVPFVKGVEPFLKGDGQLVKGADRLKLLSKLAVFPLLLIAAFWELGTL